MGGEVGSVELTGEHTAANLAKSFATGLRQNECWLQTHGVDTE